MCTSKHGIYSIVFLCLSVYHTTEIPSQVSIYFADMRRVNTGTLCYSPNSDVPKNTYDNIYSKRVMVRLPGHYITVLFFQPV